MSAFTLNRFVRVLPNTRHAWRSRLRTCGCCLRFTLFVALGVSEEFHRCVRCFANRRYEILASEIRARFPDLHRASVLELDESSALRPMLQHASSYKRTFYDENKAKGARSPSGAQCEDLTALTFADESFDLIVSSDVLEHIPDLEAVFRETHRVLKPGGLHLFTVPPRVGTRPRAILDARGTRHLLPPEYHRDPRNPSGILTFWDIGPDLSSVVDVGGLDVSIVYRDGTADDRRVVWMARRPERG